jgi:hypothetical protein
MGTMSSRFGNAGLAPYTEEEDATTTWGAVAPRRFQHHHGSGGVDLVGGHGIGQGAGTEGRAAKWTIAWAPSIDAVEVVRRSEWSLP